MTMHIQETVHYIGTRLRSSAMICWRYRKVIAPLVFAFIILITVVIVLFMQTPPRNFPQFQHIEIPSGYSLSETATLLAEKDVVRSALFLQVVVLTHYPDDDVKAGTYYFDQRLSVAEVAAAITEGTFGVPPIRITIPEGLRIDQVAVLVAQQSDISEAAFLRAAEGYEGYLFPETYHIPNEFTARELVELMYETFEEKIAPYRYEIRQSGHTLDEIITMASIIEREAGNRESKHLVSGVLWRRIAIGMPLQADAVFEYEFKESAANLTKEDLGVDSAFNTYKNIGLPPQPIANPGLDSILAALDPVSTPYLFYLTAPDGTFHYSETYAEHAANVNRYLR